MSARKREIELVNSLAYAWLVHRGYTAADIAKGKSETHERAGCKFEGRVGYYQHTDGNGKSLHPLMDALNEAFAWALFAVGHFFDASFAGEVRGPQADFTAEEEVLVEGSFFKRSELPVILGNFMRLADQYARDTKAAPQKDGSDR